MAREQWQGKDVVVLTCPKKNRFGSTHFRSAMRQLFIPTPAGPRFIIMEVTDWKPSGESKQEHVAAEVIQYVKGHPGTNQKDIEEALGMGDRNVKKALLNGKNAGSLRVVKGKRKELCWYDEEFEEDAAVEDVLKNLAPIVKPS